MKRSYLRLFCAFALVCSIVPLHATIAPELREDGVLYFEDNLPGRIFATINASLTIYAHRDFQTAVAQMYPGSKIEILGMANEGYLLKATYRNNTVTGWIHPEDLPSGVNPSIFAQAKKIQAWRDTVNVAITNKNVIQGMTPDEVKQAVGKPDQVTTRTDDHGTSVVWTYTTYREDPQYEYVLNGFGQAVLQTYYVKVPIGQMTIGFANGTVATILQKRSDPNGAGIVNN